MEPVSGNSLDELTETQRELLQLALREGYFEVPRRVSLVGLAASQDLSDRETSRQLRWGLDAVLRAALCEE